VTAQTLLVITPVVSGNGFGLTPFSARDAQIALHPWTGIGGDDAFGDTVQMSTNGVGIDLSHVQFELLETLITCTDIDAPMLNNAWRGQKVQIDFPCERSYPVGGTADRPAVAGSTPRTANGIVYYRPTLLMIVTMVHSVEREFRHKYSWQLKAIETVS
jgi:hypothetical protein